MGKKQAISYFILAAVIGFFGFTDVLAAAAWGGNPTVVLAIVVILLVLTIMAGFGTYHDKKWAQWLGAAVWIVLIPYFISYTRFFINISQGVTIAVGTLVLTFLLVIIRRKITNKKTPL